MPVVPTMGDQKTLGLGLDLGANAFRNLSPPRVRGSMPPVVVFGAPPPVGDHTCVPNFKKKKRVATATTDVHVGGRWLDAIVANILDLWRRNGSDATMVH